MPSYEELRQRHLARLFDVLPGAIADLTLPADQLRVKRETGLRAIVAHAKERSPWHCRRLAALDEARITEEGLRALPTMTKDDLMTSFDEIVTDRRLTRDVAEEHLRGLTSDAYLLDEYHACASGGSSGRRGVFVFDFDAWAVLFASYIRFSIRFREQELGPDAGPPSRGVVVAADKASHMTSALSQTFAMPGATMRRLSAAEPLPRLIEQIEEIQPDFLGGYATMMHQLAREALAGRLRVAPRAVSTMSEPLLPEIRAALHDAWGVPIINGFGSTEGLMGGSCLAGRGIHLSDDLFVIEPVDARGAPAALGERAAKIYLTSLVGRLQPLIRYELTDEVTVLDGPCPCGSTLLRIDDVQGRADDAFVYAGCPPVHPFTFRSVLGRERAIVEYQVRQTARGADVAVRCDGAVDLESVAAALRAALSGAGLADAEIRVESVASLARQESGKLSRFVPLENRQDTAVH